MSKGSGTVKKGDSSIDPNPSQRLQKGTLRIRIPARLESMDVKARNIRSNAQVKNSDSGSSSDHFPHIIYKNSTIFMVSKNIFMFFKAIYGHQQVL
jgi:hypothetical protein